jgi:O-antigen/teichoic acid export membrane protein
MIQTTVSIVSIFGILQLETALQRFYYEIEEGKRKIIASTVLIFVSLISFFLMGILQILSPFISQKVTATQAYKWPICIGAILIPLNNISTISLIIIRYNKKPVIFAAITVLQIFITAGITIVSILFNLGIISIFYGQVAGIFFSVCLGFIYLRKFYIKAFDIIALKQMFRYALPQFPARAGSVAHAYMNRFIMLDHLSIAAIGIYSVALRCASIISIVQAIFGLVWYPFMNEKINYPDHKELFKKYFKFICLVIGTMISLVILFSKEIISLVVSNEFKESSNYVGALALYMGLFVINDYVSIGPLIKKRTIFNTYIYAIVSLINFVTLLYFSSKFGLDGIVWSMVFSNIALVILSFFISEKLYYIGFSKACLFVFILVEIIISALTMYFDISITYRFLMFVIVCIILIIISKVKVLSITYTRETR